MARVLSIALAVTLSVACAPPPRPAVMAEVDRTRTSEASKEASSLAPQAFLAAEKLRADAEKAFNDGDRAGAELLAEQAVAAYTRATVLARLAKATDRTTAAGARLEQSRKDFTALEEKQHRALAEADDLELRLRVLRDALPVAKTDPASGDREASRLAAARALSAEARLLCVATQMLHADTPGVVAAFKDLEALDAEIQKHPARAPIDEAIRLRSACLTELSALRRAGSPESASADKLLEELGTARFEPHRDERGVVVTLRDAFSGTGPSPAARTRVTELGQVARTHPDFPLLVVVHAARGAQADRDRARAEAFQRALVEAGATRVETRAAGDALPILPKDAGAGNERVEIVFVAPSP